jgi:DNA-binding protein HU-beta
MLRADLVQRIGNQLDTTEKEAEKILGAVLNGFTEGLVEDGNLIIRGFGRFVVKDKKERMGRNPKTGQPAVITARKSVSFKSSKILKQLVHEEANKNV